MSLPEFDVSGQKVLIVGAGRGIGKGIAQVFAAQGAKVMIGSRGESDGNATVEELWQKAG